MCGISGFELVVILAAVIIFVGPEKLPEMMRAVGRVARELRRLRGDLGKVTREITSTVGVDDLKESVRASVDVDRVRSRMKDAESEIDAIRARLKRPAGVEPAVIEGDSQRDAEESLESSSGELDPRTVIATPDAAATPSHAQGGPPLTPAELQSSNPSESLARPARVEPEERLAAALNPKGDT
jgi:Tat protein translocase TatB subunit